ncbi:hypothetical protein [Halosegnis marinus]|uniref:hypothetical protein n=1 Tax=Halosegnis marinus TaxID=3034023 RepID=UPI0036154FB5
MDSHGATTKGGRPAVAPTDPTGGSQLGELAAKLPFLVAMLAGGRGCRPEPGRIRSDAIGVQSAVGVDTALAEVAREAGWNPAASGCAEIVLGKRRVDDPGRLIEEALKQIGEPLGDTRANGGAVAGGPPLGGAHTDKPGVDHDSVGLRVGPDRIRIELVEPLG